MGKAKGRHDDKKNGALHAKGQEKGDRKGKDKGKSINKVAKRCGIWGYMARDCLHGELVLGTLFHGRLTRWQRLQHV